MKILFFAQLVQATGKAELELAIDQPISGDELWRRLSRDYPALGAFKSHTRLARDCEYVPWDSLLENHHEVALIPPVSGG